MKNFLLPVLALLVASPSLARADDAPSAATCKSFLSAAKVVYRAESDARNAEVKERRAHLASGAAALRRFFTSLSKSDEELIRHGKEGDARARSLAHDLIDRKLQAAVTGCGRADTRPYFCLRTDGSKKLSAIIRHDEFGVIEVTDTWSSVDTANFGLTISLGHGDGKATLEKALKEYFSPLDPFEVWAGQTDRVPPECFAKSTPKHAQSGAAKKPENAAAVASAYGAGPTRSIPIY